SDSPCDHLSIRIYSAWGFTITSCTVLWARSESVTSCGSDLREPLPGGAGHLANTRYSPGARPVIEKWPTWSATSRSLVLRQASIVYLQDVRHRPEAVPSSRTHNSSHFPNVPTRLYNS